MSLKKYFWTDPNTGKRSPLFDTVQEMLNDNIPGMGNAMPREAVEAYERVLAAYGRYQPAGDPDAPIWGVADNPKTP